MSKGQSPPYALLDAPEDGGIEEWGWVPADWAETPEAAVAWFLDQCPEAIEGLDDDMVLIATGETSWHRMSPCLDCEGTGADEYSYPGDVPIRPFPACTTCNGTGEQAEDADYIAWKACKPDDDGAVEFWTLQVVEREIAEAS
jgi:hypothetical protein